MTEYDYTSRSSEDDGGMTLVESQVEARTRKDPYVSATENTPTGCEHGFIASSIEVHVVCLDCNMTWDTDEAWLKARRQVINRPPATRGIVTLWDGRRGYFYKADALMFQPIGDSGVCHGKPEVHTRPGHPA